MAQNPDQKVQFSEVFENPILNDPHYINHYFNLSSLFQGRKLKCDHCKHKYSYTLDYARHVDTHPFPGLACRICQCSVTNPKEYGEHMEIHHPSVIFSQPTPDPQQQQEHTASFSNQDLLSTEEMLNIVPTAGNPVRSSVNPMEDQSVHEDFLNEEEVFEAILDGEQNEAALSPHTPAAEVQNQYR